MKDSIPDPAAPWPVSRALRTAIIPMAMIGAIAGAQARQPPAEARASRAFRESATTQADELAAAFKAVTGKPHRLKDGEHGTTTTPLRLLHLPFGPVLITARVIDDPCMTCGGWMGIYYLDQHGATFSVRKRWPQAIQGWVLGQIPQHWSITSRFTKWPAIYAAGGIVDSGYDCEGSVIAELRPEGPAISDLINTHFSNEGAQADAETPDGEAPRVAEGRIANIVRGKSFIVHATGTATFTEHYVMRGKRFVRLEKTSRLTC